MRFSRFAYLCVALSLFPLCSSSQAQRQMASLRPERGLVWKRASPTVQQPDSPVLYQLIFNSSGVPGTVPVFDTNPRHLTSSPITISGGNVMIGGGGNGLIINGATGIVSFANGQTFPGGTGVSSVTAGNGFITIGGTTANPTVGLNTTATDARYLQLSGGTMTGTITFAPTQTFPGLANLAGEVTGAPSATVVSNAVPANTASAIVRRDGSGNFSAGTINLSGNLALPVTNGAGSAGVISFGGTPFIQNFGGNIFIGPSAGNTTTTGIDNIAIGASALHSSAGQFNNAFGVFALNSMTQAGNNNAFGAYALFSTTGDNVGNGSGNAAFGDSALYSNTLGSGNNAFGHNALYRNTGDTAHNGSYNEAFGDQALFSNTLGSANAAFGASALGSNTTGNFNAAFGNRALLGGTGSFNAAFGYQALFVNNASHNDAFGYNTLINLGAAGSFNTAVGDQAASLLISGNHNIAIGDSAGINLGAGDNNIYIGHPGPASSGASESNTIRIGNAQTQTFIVGAITGNGSGLTALNVNMGNVNGILSISNGGTGSSTQNFVDLANNQSIGGVKNFSNYVGIGTSAPVAPVHIADLNGLRIGTGSSGAFLTGVPTTPGNVWLGANMDSFNNFVNGAQRSWALNMSLNLDQVQFLRAPAGSVSPAAIMTLNGNGNVDIGTTHIGGSGDVGIGTPFPAAKLDVRGNVKLGDSGQLRYSFLFNAGCNRHSYGPGTTLLRGWSLGVDSPTPHQWG